MELEVFEGVPQQLPRTLAGEPAAPMPSKQSVAQLGRSGATMTNQLFSAYMGEPRTYGVTLRGKF